MSTKIVCDYCKEEIPVGSTKIQYKTTVFAPALEVIWSVNLMKYPKADICWTCAQTALVEAGKRRGV